MTQPVLVILAAGMGSRYGGVKQIDPVGPNGEIVLDYSVYDARRAGFGKVVFVIRRELEEVFRDHVGNRLADQIEIDYVFQELDAGLPAEAKVPANRTKPWGTGHAIMVCEDAVQEAFCVINADDFYGATAFDKMADFLTDCGDKEYAMVGFRLGNTLSEHGTVSRGICQVQHGLLQTVVERTRIGRKDSEIAFEDEDGKLYPLSANQLVSMNFWGFTPTLFPKLKEQFRAFLRSSADDPKAEFYIPFVIDRLIQEEAKRVHVLETPDHWFGVTYPEDKEVVIQNIRALIRQGIYPERLWPT